MRAVRGAVGDDPDQGQAGTTLMAMLLSGSQLALVHIGYSRVYLLRERELFQQLANGSKFDPRKRR